MTWVKGRTGNPAGTSKVHRRLLTKVRSSLDMAIDGLGTASHGGATEMASLITQALRDDVIGTLKALQGFFPKDIHVDVQHSGASKTLSDDDLADIIALRTQLALSQIEAKTIDGELVVSPDMVEIDADSIK